MCGIGGIFVVGDHLLPSAQVEDLFRALDDRGGHASGVAWKWQGSDKVVTFKAPLTAQELASRAMAKVGLRVRFVLLHTRYTTQGSTSNNGNNHPIVGHGITLTHNGVISNDRQMFREVGVTPLHEVDSEAINAMLGASTPSHMVETLRGSMSIAWVEGDEDKVNLMTNGRNPLVIGRTVEGHIVWASNLYHLEAFNLESHFNAEPFKHYTIAKDGVIRSTWASDDRRTPTVLGRNSHVASYGSYDPLTSKGFTSRRSSTTKKQKKPVRGSKLIQGGWVYDERNQSWRKARRGDF